MTELGTAEIVYETGEGEVERAEVHNDRIVHFDDHWLFEYGTDDDGNDVVRRVPRDRVYHVERSVEEVEESFETAVDRAKNKLEEIGD